MTLPANTNPKFLAWYDAQPRTVRNDIDARWTVTASDERLFPGHRSEEYARLTFLIQYASETYGYA